jgi:carboxyl-terminal processing protease
MGRAALLSAVVVSGMWATARGQEFPASIDAARGATAETVEVDQILREGVRLEEQRHWAEALTHYEDALRKHPGRPDLSQRLQVARAHYEVARRYGDHSFVDAVQRMNERQALDLYSDVTLKIQSHYVEQPSWRSLLQRGNLALEIALLDGTFQQQNRLQLSPSVVQAHLGELNHALTSRPVRTRQEARDAVSFIAHATSHRLGVAPQVIVLEYACAAGSSLDDYSSFLTGNQLDEVMSQIEGNFVGLGIELKAEADSLLIVNVIPRGPAEQSGLVAGDRIVEVDGQTMADISTDVAADMLKGEEGTAVGLVVVTAAGVRRRLRIVRQVVEVPNIEQVTIVDPNYGVGYLKLTSFQKTTSRDVEAALWQLHRQGMRSLIIDLRGNPGGLLTASVEMADKFISEGTIVSTRGRGNGEDFDYKAHLIGTWRVPLVVLINGDSASASEIFAAAIRDSQRGTIVGQRSFGKGSVQGIFPLTVGHAGLRLTTAKFYSPNGTAISGRGVQPHVMVPASQQTVAKPVLDEAGQPVLPATTDEALLAALQVARQQVAQR